MANEHTERSSPVTPIIDNPEKGTLTCPVCGEKGQRSDRRLYQILGDFATLLKV